MFYHLIYPLSKYISVLNVVHYTTFRAASAFVMSFLLIIIFWPMVIRRLKNLKIEERVDMYGHIHLEALHEDKKGTPTMGGILVAASVFISLLFWARWDNVFIWYSVFVIVSLGLVGLKDDLLKIKFGKGMKRGEKLLFQIIIGLCLGAALFLYRSSFSILSVPFFKKLVINLGFFYIFWVALVIISTSNAVNFTDGLDGLAIGVIVINSFVFAVLSYIAGHVKFSAYLFIPYIRGAGELSVLCSSIAGAGLGFLWFNSYPAQIFMGDVGALSLGGAIGAIAVFVKQEFILVIAGGIFVIEALSVLLQIFSVRIFKKKMLKAAPFHHHLQLLGWPESKIVIRLWIVAVIFAVFAIMTLKLR